MHPNGKTIRRVEEPKWRLAFAILSVWFSPFGLVSVIYAVKSHNRWRAGETAAANRYCELAVSWAVVGIVTQFLLAALLIASTWIPRH
jgi:hypothetical protein